MKAAIFRVVKPGLQTTVQDLGRQGFQQFGVSPSGAMDSYSMQIANILVGNTVGKAVLEASLIGPQLEALSDMTIAVCGGNFSLRVEGHDVPMWRSFLLKQGQILSLGTSKQGIRAYLAISGGIDVPSVLDSKSTFLNGGFGGHEGRALRVGDILYGDPSLRKPYKLLHSDLIPEYKKQMEVRVILGPHQHRFTEQSLRRFFTEPFIITPQSNRMGYQLTGPKLEHTEGPDIISDPIPRGGIQVPASGQPIILMADRQTTGGYTRIGTVISSDIPLLAQAIPGTTAKFVETTIQEAQTLYLKRAILLKHLALTNK